ncbi:MAG: flagellar hook-length control protein FliK [Sulfurimonas sp.]|nr:flagellar hook-length control protein FliK [Sulfurimonas sp.]
MINISSASNLGIIVPSKNKALAQVLSNATDAQLETLTQSKDLKSVMNTILKQSADATSTNKELLSLVKNNPTLKNLGDVSTTIKDLLSSLKSDASQQSPIEKTLKTFLIDIKDLKNAEFKQKLENSGVFLESKLKQVQNPQIELKNTLISLVKNLQAHPSPQNTIIANEAKVLLNTEVLKAAQVTDIEKNIQTNPKTLEKLSLALESLVVKLKSSLKSTDTIHNPTLTKSLEKLEHLFDSKMLKPENFNLSNIKESLQEISLHINKSFTMESKGILDSLEKIFTALKNVEQTTTTSKAAIAQLIEKNVTQDITKLNERINLVILKADPLFSKDTALLLHKLESLNTPQTLHTQNNVKEIIAGDLKAVLLQAGEEIAKSNHPNQNDVLKNIEKLSLQIDNYQLLSHLSNGNSLFLPFAWDMLEDGNIQMKKDDDEKFYCDIHLQLKEYGEVNLKLTLYDKNQLNLHIYSANEDFKGLIQDAIPSLRSGLIDEQITPREIRIFDLKTKLNTSPYSNTDEQIHMGFEVKG